MQPEIHPDSSTRTATMGGFVFSMLIQIGTEDLVRTSLLAAVGAAVSFAVSKLLKWTCRRWKR